MKFRQKPIVKLGRKYLARYTYNSNLNEYMKEIEVITIGKGILFSKIYFVCRLVNPEESSTSTFTFFEKDFIREL